MIPTRRRDGQGLIKVRMPLALVARLRLRADAERRSGADIIRTALEHYLDSGTVEIRDRTEARP